MRLTATSPCGLFNQDLLGNPAYADLLADLVAYGQAVRNGY